MTVVDGYIRIGGFILELPYGEEPGKVGIYRCTADGNLDGEGGDFDAEQLEHLISEFYKENF